MIEFNCSECGRKLQALSEDAGKTITCIHCGKEVQVPSAYTAHQEIIANLEKQIYDDPYPMIFTAKLGIFLGLVFILIGICHLMSSFTITLAFLIGGFSLILTAIIVFMLNRIRLVLMGIRQSIDGRNNRDQ